MRGLLDFLWLVVRCAAFIWTVSAVLILILFTVGSEAEGLTLGEKLITALKYAAYVGGIFGTLLAVFIWWQNWKISRRNKKTRARQDKTKQKTSS